MRALRWTTGCALGLVAAIGCGGKAPTPVTPTPVVEAPKVTPAVNPEDDDGVELVGTRGKLEPAQIEAAVAPHAAALEACFQAEAANKRWLGGGVALVWQVGRDGAVMGHRLAESTIGSWAVERCLHEAAAQVTFPPPKGGEAEAVIPLEFNGKGRVVVWAEEEATRVVGARLADLEACAEDGQAPSSVVLTLYVGTRGKVQALGFWTEPATTDDDPTVTPTPLAAIDPTWATCVESKAKAWTLRDPKGKVAKLAVRYPSP